MDISKALNERLFYLNQRVNTLTIQCLALGFVPKLKTGKEMSKDNLTKLRNEIQQLIANEELRETKLLGKPKTKQSKAPKSIPSNDN